MFGLRFRGEYPAVIAQELDALVAQFKAWLTVDHNEDGTHNLRPSGFDFVPIGAGMDWYTDTAPDRWVFARGQAVSRTTYQALFALYSTTYGAGDGSTTFNLPNRERRVAIGKAASGSASTLGSTGGSFDHSHTLSGGTTGSGGSFSTSTGSDGSHTHSVSGSTGTASTTFSGDFPPGALIVASDHIHDISGTADASGSHTHSVSVGDHTHALGGGSTDASNQAYLVVNHIILAGV